MGRLILVRRGAGEGTIGAPLAAGFTMRDEHDPRSKWSPAARVAVGSLGASLIGYGLSLALSRRRYVGIGTVIVGLGALARSASSLGARERLGRAVRRLRGGAAERSRLLGAHRREPAEEELPSRRHTH